MWFGWITFLTFFLQTEPRRNLIEHAVDEAARFLVAITISKYLFLPDSWANPANLPFRFVNWSRDGPNPYKKFPVG